MIFVVVSTGHFDPLIAECAKLSDRYEFLGQIGSSNVVPPFPHFRTGTPDEIEKHMRDAELVVTHGGAGMTAMLYRLKKKSVIIPKQRRYGEANDLQIQLAKKWGQLGVGEFCLDVDKLESAIEICRRNEYRFPKFPSLGRYLAKSLGLPPAVPLGSVASAPVLG